MKKSERAYLIGTSPLVVVIGGLILSQGLTNTNVLFGVPILLIGLEFFWKGLNFERALIRSTGLGSALIGGIGVAMLPLGIIMQLSNFSFTSLIGGVLFCCLGASYLAVGLRAIQGGLAYQPK